MGAVRKSATVSHGHSDKKRKVKMFALLVLALVASASAIDSKCPEVKAVENFELLPYAKGKWYEIARYHNYAERMSNCGIAEYKLEGDVFKVNNSGVYNHKMAFIEGIGRLAEDAGGRGIIHFSMPYGASGKITQHRLNILTIDYDKYLIGYYCQYDEELKSYEEFSWILARTKVLSSDSKAKVDKFIDESKLLQRSKYIWPDFSDEVCAIKA